MNKRKIPVTLTGSEVRKIIDQPNKRTPTGLRNKAILSFVWDNGARTGDIINLRPNQVNLESKEAILKEGKYGVDRTVNFSSYTAELLKQYKKHRPKSDYLFCTLKGNKLSRKYLYNMARRYAKRTQINKPVGLHTLRHSFALKYYQDSNHDLFGLQKILGHSRISSTQIYCYIDNTHVKKGLESFYSKRDKGNDSKDKNIEEKIKTLEEEIQNIKTSI